MPWTKRTSFLERRPDERGYFGQFGGRYVPEILISALEELTRVYEEIRKDPDFFGELERISHGWSGRPTPLWPAEKLSAFLGGAKIYFKREDLLHTGAHKINNALGQALLAKRIGKKRIVAETGAGQHGVAVASVCALLGLNCVIYMGEKDMNRQRMNVMKMELLRAEVKPVTTGSKTLKEAINEALRDWVTNQRTTHYLLGSAVGPHPYPMIVRDFQRVIGQEAKKQIIELAGRLPDYVVACVGGGSNALGIFSAFMEDKGVQLIGVEAGGKGLRPGYHAASLAAGQVGILHGAKTYVLQNKEGQIQVTHSISAGLDYPAVGPELSYLKESGRIQSVTISDQEALEAFNLCCRHEGIIPALESSHALAQAIKLALKSDREKIILVNLSGRGDKDLEIIRKLKS